MAPRACSADWSPESRQSLGLTLVSRLALVGSCASAVLLKIIELVSAP
jgi:hypothetical protein